MGKRFGFLLFFVLQGFLGYSSHLVGGEFEIIHLEGNTYLFRQIQYFDVLTGNPGAKDDSIQASIFRKSDNIYVRNVTMRLVFEEKVFYSNPSCEDSRLSTRRQVYEATITLDPHEFDDPEGYYMVWERCCRNITLNNITNPDETGQTFYIEFPELIRNGERFINSSPQLFPPLSDYACVNQFYYADFTGFDADGDSLVYSMVSPLNSTISDTILAVPTPSPAPHAAVNWVDGYSASSQIPGNGPLAISPEGLLTVTPSQTGLFVFSIKVDEYRNGEKIGEVRRDFQMLVVDCPPPGSKPEIKVKRGNSDTYQDALGVVNINYGDDTCFDIIVNDNDPNEHISIKAIPVNFVDSLDDNLSTNSGIILNPSDTFKLSFCLPQCILEGSFSPAIVDIYAFDDRCPQSLIDTLRIVANIQQPPNALPQITLPASEIENKLFLEGTDFSLPFRGIDPDNDSLSLRIIPVDFTLEDYGITVDTVEISDGEVEYQLNWNTDCVNYPLGDKNEFDLMAVLEDYDECGKPNADTAYYHVTIELPPNTSPTMTVNGWGNDTTLTLRIEELRNFLVEAVDHDGDQLTISAQGLDFKLGDLGLDFPELTGIGSVEQGFPWKVDCGMVSLEEQDTFWIQFIVEDHDKCKVKSADTINLTIHLAPPLNNAPHMTINGQPSVDTLFYEVGQNVLLDIVASDPDGDNIDLVLHESDSLHSNLGVDFQSEISLASATATFSWNLRCEHLADEFKDKTYAFQILSNDDKCYSADTTTREVVVVVQDKHVDYDFLPPNAFTPNAEDDINRYYYMPFLPIDNCASQFEEIIIFNRWGKEVFRSDSRDFRWSGLGNTTGVYYYTLIYSHRSFKGIINLIK